MSDTALSLLMEMVEEYPWTSEDFLEYCFYCGNNKDYNHTSNCLWLRAKALLDLETVDKTCPLEPKIPKKVQIDEQGICNKAAQLIKKINNAHEKTNDSKIVFRDDSAAEIPEGDFIMNSNFRKMKIYIPDNGKNVELREALNIITDTWIDFGQYSKQTIIDMKNALKAAVISADIRDGFAKTPDTCECHGVTDCPVSCQLRGSIVCDAGQDEICSP